MTTQADRSLGASVETTFGTIVTPSKFLEPVEESLDWNPTFPQGMGMRVGQRVLRRDRRSQVPAKQMVGGDVKVEAASKGLGWLFQAALGAVVTTQRGATGVYQQNHTPTLTDFLNSYTWQVGDPPLGGGATVAYTLPGMVCSGFELDCPNGDIAMLTTSWVGREVNTATAYSAPTYPTPVELFEFQEGAITIGGTVTPATATALAAGGTAVATIRDFNVKWDNKLDDDGFNFGGGGKRTRKPAVGAGDGMLSGHFTAEFSDNTLRDAMLNQVDLALTLTMIGASTIGASDHPALQVSVPVLRLENGALPHASAGEVLTNDMDWTGLSDLSNAPITVSYVSTDTLP